jgi:hypothetical protein
VLYPNIETTRLGPAYSTIRRWAVGNELGGRVRSECLPAAQGDLQNIASYRVCQYKTYDLSLEDRSTGFETLLIQMLRFGSMADSGLDARAAGATPLAEVSGSFRVSVPRKSNRDQGTKQSGARFSSNQPLNRVLAHSLLKNGSVSDDIRSACGCDTSSSARRLVVL